MPGDSSLTPRVSPQRVRLSRAKGWRLPDNTVIVSRPTPWGNPFKVGVDGDAARSVELYHTMLAGYFCISCKTEFDAQKVAVAYARKNIKKLRGKNLACWCRLDKPCHADVLLEIANQPETRGEANPNSAPGRRNQP